MDTTPLDRTEYLLSFIKRSEKELKNKAYTLFLLIKSQL